MSRISNRRAQPSHRQDDQPSRQPNPINKARRIGILVVTGSLLAAGVVSFAAERQLDDDPVAQTANLVRNGSFDNGLSGWRVKAPGTMRLITPGHNGGSAVRLGTTSTATVALNDDVNSVASATKGSTFRATAWIRTTTPNVTAQLRLREVAGSGPANQGSSQLWLQDTAWHQVSFEYTTQTAGSTLDLNLVAWQLGASQSIDVDDVSLTTTVGTPVVVPTAAPSPTAVPTSAKPTTSPTTSVKATGSGSSDPKPGNPGGGGGNGGDDCSLNSKLVPSCGVLWGMYTKPLQGEASDKAFTNLESKTGRKFDIVKRYHDWSNKGGNGQFPDKSEQALGASGERILYFAWVSNIYSTGGHASWKDIAAGKYDQSVILPQAARFKAWGKPVFMGYDHEADGATRKSFGSDADYVAAFRHIHDVLQGAGVKNVVYVYNPTGFLGNADRIKAQYPGDKYVDWIAYDPYNFYLCHSTGWKTPESTFSAFYNYAMSVGWGDKPFMLGEYGTGVNPSDGNAMGDWYAGVASALAKMPNIKAAIQWDSTISGKYCDFRVSTNPKALQGFAKSGLSDLVSLDE
jgi:Carbohydrate binding domain/Glycosyl hydrolase family 26